MRSSMKLNLSVKKIFEKEFNTSRKGFDQQEVNEFLDLVIEDYETIAKYIQDVKQTNQELRDENYRLKKEMMQRKNGVLSQEDTLDLLPHKVQEVVESAADMNDDIEETRRLDDLEQKMDRMEKILLHLEEKL